MGTRASLPPSIYHLRHTYRAITEKMNPICPAARMQLLSRLCTHPASTCFSFPKKCDSQLPPARVTRRRTKPEGRPPHFVPPLPPPPDICRASSPNARVRLDTTPAGRTTTGRESPPRVARKRRKGGGTQGRGSERARHSIVAAPEAGEARGRGVHRDPDRGGGALLRFLRGRGVLCRGGERRCREGVQRQLKGEKPLRQGLVM